MHLELRPDLGRAPWTDLNTDKALYGHVERMGLLPQGTAGGRPTLALVVRLPDGRAVVAETTWALMRASLRALDASPIGERDRKENP